ncbi:MAG: hypothetical protein J6Y19_03305 [Kiritimatiellae bacterium]|nr:hypothetical protein [Kiritimatiellia bacterium]
MGLLVLAGVFFLKVAWNLTVPFELARRRDERAGISLMPYFEIGVWVVWLLLACFSDGDGWWQSPKKVAVWGGVAILGSYAGMMALGAGLGLLAAARAKRKGQLDGSGGEGEKPARRRGGAGNFSRKARKGRKGRPEEGGRMAERKRES